MTWKMDFKLEGGDIASIQQVLRVLPKRLRNGAMRKAGREASNIVLRNVKPLVPMSKRDPKQHGPFQSQSKNNGAYIHLRDGIVSKIKTYNNAVVAMVGVRTKQKLFHAHLIEFGTRMRYTRHTTQSSAYVTVGTRWIKKRGTDGKLYKKERPIKRSTGSTIDMEKLKKGPMRKTGVGPAYHYLSRGWAQAEPGVIATIEYELRKALATSGVSV